MAQDPPKAEYGVVLVTAPSKEVAVAIASPLIQEKLAACVSLLPVESIYTWQAQVHQEQEWQLLIKTNLAQYPALEARVKEIHPYEVPEIIAVPILQGFSPYLQWLGEQVDEPLANS